MSRETFLDAKAREFARTHPELSPRQLKLFQNVIAVVAATIPQQCTFVQGKQLTTLEALRLIDALRDANMRICRALPKRFRPEAFETRRGRPRALLGDKLPPHPRFNAHSRKQLLLVVEIWKAFHGGTDRKAVLEWQKKHPDVNPKTASNQLAKARQEHSAVLPELLNKLDSLKRREKKRS